MKILILLLTSFIWLPLLLTGLIVLLLFLIALLVGLILLILVPLIWMIKFRYNLSMAYQEVFKELGSNLNDIRWWRLWRMVFRKYKKLSWDRLT